MQVEIKFVKPCWSAAFGAFETDDVLRCGAAVADHFVDAAQAAIYVGQAAVQVIDAAVQAPEEAAAPVITRRRRLRADAAPVAQEDAQADAAAQSTERPEQADLLAVADGSSTEPANTAAQPVQE
jgi:hypothetical protein